MKSTLPLFLFLILNNFLFGQLDFDRNFFKDFYDLDKKIITKTEAVNLLKSNYLSNQFLTEATRNDLIRNISSGAFVVGIGVQVIEILTTPEGEDYSSIYSTSGFIGTAGFIVALVTNQKAKNRYKRAVSAYNSNHNSFGFKPKLLVAPDRVGVVFKLK